MRLLPLSVVALAMGLFVSTSALRAEEVAPAVGTVTGKVVDADGKAVSGADVKVAAFVAKKAGEAKGKGVAEDGGAKKAPRADRVKPAGLSAKTDADGSFKVANVPAGTYTVMAKSADGAMGKAAAEVIVKGGDTVDAGTITVKAKPAGAKKGQ